MAQLETEMKTRKAVKSGRKNMVGGFLVDKVDDDVMRRYISEHELEVDTDVTAEQLAVALYSHFKETVEENDLVRCDNCEGVSGATETMCPFCGDTGDVEDEEVSASGEEAEEETAEETEEEAPKQEEAVKKKAEETEEEETEETEETEEAEEAEETEEETTTDTEEASEEEEPEVQAAQVVRRRGRPPGVKNKKAAVAAPVEKKKMSTAQVNGVSSVKKSVELVKTKSSSLSARALDHAVADVKRLKGSSAESYWELANKILEINTKQLWKLRLDDNGKSRYRSFDAFVHAELNMSPQHAYSAMDIAKGYETAEEIREIGATKALLLLKVAPEDRKKLTAKAKAGATARELKQDVKKSRAEKGSPKGDSPKAKAGAKGAATKAKVNEVKSEKITIASIEGSKTIKLYKKPESLRALDFSTLTRAQNIKDQPFGRYEMANGVVQYFSVINKEGVWCLKIETRREVTED